MLKTSDVLFIQETTQQAVSLVPVTLESWYLTLHKHADEWRSQGILSRREWGLLKKISEEVGTLAIEIEGGDGRPIGVVSLHLPPKPTIDETQTLLDKWGRCKPMISNLLYIGFDTNETFD